MCYNACMGKHKKKKTRRDTAEIARSIVEQAIGETLSGEPELEAVEDQEPDTRNPAAVALNRLGASKGGKARAKKLSREERVAAARNAANKRWQNNKNNSK